MVRLIWVSFVSLFVVACAGHESAAASGEAPAKTDTRTQDPAGVQPEACKGLLLPDDVSLRQTGQSSLGGATTDITIDLKTGKMTGTDYKLDTYGDTPIALVVDQQASPEGLAKLRQRFESTCAPRRKAETQEYSAPGGYSLMQVKHADGSTLFISRGITNLPEGATVAEIARKDWLPLYEAWPPVEGKFDSNDPPV